MSRSHRTTRRRFLQDAVTTGTTLAAVPYFAFAQDKAKPDGDKAAAPQPAKTYPQLRVAYIATGGIGGFHLENAGRLGVTCPCFCDVDTNKFAAAFERYPKARAYQDYRAMLEKEEKNIDAVMIGTPDHHHYPATILAMQMGKHVYTQKPLTQTPWEARQLTEAAKKYKVATQMGNQGRAKEGWRLIYEWIHSGAIGTIKEVHTWTDRPIWPQGVGRPEGDGDKIPPGLNWDVWLGPAPERPYKAGSAPDKPGPYHWFNWRGWWDFGAGALGDMACHTMDCVFASLDPGHPTSIEPLTATPVNNETFPKASALKWEFPSKGNRPAFAAYWYDGGLLPPMPEELEAGRKVPSTGNLFIGTKASLLVAGDYADSPRIIPEKKMQEIGKPPQLLERSPGHVDEWVMACVGDKPLDFPKSNFSYAGPFSEVILLGNVALRVGRKLLWDGPNLKITNIPEANQFLTKEYRSGWKF